MNLLTVYIRVDAETFHGPVNFNARYMNFYIFKLYIFLICVHFVIFVEERDLNI